MMHKNSQTSERQTSNPKKHLVLFDLDGTLLKHFYSEDNLFLLAMHSVCADFDPSMPYWHDCPHLTDEFVFHYLFENKLNRKAESFEYERMRENFVELLFERAKENENYFVEVEGANRLVSYIEDHSDADCAIVTGSWLHIAQAKFELMGWNGALPPIYSSDIAPSKPEFLNAALDSFGRDNYERLTYIGDSIYDMEVARNAGLEFIGLDARDKMHFPSDVQIKRSFEPLDDWINQLAL